MPNRPTTTLSSLGLLITTTSDRLARWGAPPRPSKQSAALLPLRLRLRLGRSVKSESFGGLSTNN